MPRTSRCVLSLIGVAWIFAPVSAQASLQANIVDVADGVISYLGLDPKTAVRPKNALEEFDAKKPELAAHALEPLSLSGDEAPPLPAIAPEKPFVERPLHRLFCVEYARMRSGMTVFGDAKQWWTGARNLYARISHPVEEAVMVFAGSARLKRGHVAVVSHIVSAREIRVDQANWQNEGEIDHETPVLDVSPDNDWSEVRVWDMRSSTFGSHVYAIRGFLTKGLNYQASSE